MDSIVECAMERVIERLVKNYPRVPLIRDRVTAMEANIADYMAGAAKVRAGFLDSFASLARAICANHSDKDGCDWLVPGGYVRPHKWLVFLTPRGLEALETGKFAAFDEKIIELLCAEVRKQVLANFDSGE